MHEQSTKPHTLAVAMGDSPAGLAAWLVQKFRNWTDSNGNVESAFARDDLLTWITAYWVTGAIGTSFTPYAEAADKSTTPAAPVVFTTRGGSMKPCGSRRSAERQRRQPFLVPQGERLPDMIGSTAPRPPLRLRQPVEGSLRPGAAPGGQDRRGEPGPLAGLRVGAAVVDPRRGHLHRAGAGEDLAGLMGAVAHHQAGGRRRRARRRGGRCSHRPAAADAAPRRRTGRATAAPRCRCCADDRTCAAPTAAGRG